jgi:hypothetical protein
VRVPSGNTISDLPPRTPSMTDFKALRCLAGVTAIDGKVARTPEMPSHERHVEERPLGHDFEVVGQVRKQSGRIDEARMVGDVDVAATGLQLFDTMRLNPYPNRGGHHSAPPARARVLRLAAVIERPHQQRDRPHDDGLDIPEQVGERRPEIDERRLRGRVHGDSQLAPCASVKSSNPCARRN